MNVDKRSPNRTVWRVDVERIAFRYTIELVLDISGSPNSRRRVQLSYDTENVGKQREQNLAFASLSLLRANGNAVFREAPSRIRACLMGRSFE